MATAKALTPGQGHLNGCPWFDNVIYTLLHPDYTYNECVYPARCAMSRYERRTCWVYEVSGADCTIQPSKSEEYPT